MSLRVFLDRWEEFWFARTSPMSLCAYRIVHGVLLLIMQAFLAPDLLHFYGPRGILSPETARLYVGQAWADLFQWLPINDQTVIAIFAGWVAATVCFTLGLGTRAACILVWVGFCTFHHRNPLVLHSGDTYIRIMAFYFMLAPAGALLSIDRWIQIKRGKASPNEEPMVAIWPIRLMQIQFSILYVMTVWWKAGGRSWVEGTAVYYATRLEEFWRFKLPYVLEHLWTIRLMTWGTLVVELALGTIIWFKEMRYSVLLAGMALHLGIEWLMNIQLFEFIMMASFLIWVEPHHVRLVLQKLRLYPATA